MPVRFNSTWNVKLGTGLLAIPYVVLGAVVGTDGTASVGWRLAFVAGGALGSWVLWRWSRSHALVDQDGVLVVGIMRRRLFRSSEIAAVELDIAGLPVLRLTASKKITIGFLYDFNDPEKSAAGRFVAAVNSILG